MKADNATGRRSVSRAQVVIVDDDARIVRMSELRELYEVAGSLRALAEVIDLSVSTLSRLLDVSRDDPTPRDERIAAVRERLSQ